MQGMFILHIENHQLSLILLQYEEQNANILSETECQSPS